MAKENSATRAARLHQQQLERASKLPAPTLATERPQRQTTTKQEKVRITLDLAPALYRDLNAVVAQLADEIGARGQIRPEVIKVLIRQLIDDPEMQRRVVAELSVALKK